MSEWPMAARVILLWPMTLLGPIGVKNPLLVSAILGVFVVWSILDVHLNERNPIVREWSQRKRILFSVAYGCGYIISVVLLMNLKLIIGYIIPTTTPN